MNKADELSVKRKEKLKSWESMRNKNETEQSNQNEWNVGGKWVRHKGKQEEK